MHKTNRPNKDVNNMPTVVPNIKFIYILCRKFVNITWINDYFKFLIYFNYFFDDL